MKFLKRLFAGLSLVLAASAWADNFPSKPITLYVGFPAGGATDCRSGKRADRCRQQPATSNYRTDAGNGDGAEARKQTGAAAGYRADTGSCCGAFRGVD